MPYSERELEEISRDPVRLKGYFWKIAMNARRQAKQDRQLSLSTGFGHPTTNYRSAFKEGQDLLAGAKHLDSFADAILDNIDVLVKSSLEV